MKYYVIKIINGGNTGSYFGSNSYGSPMFRKSLKAKSVYRFNLISDAERMRNSSTETFKKLTEIIEVAE